MSNSIHDRHNPSRQLRVNDDGTVDVRIVALVSTTAHNSLSGLSYASSGHTGFMPANGIADHSTFTHLTYASAGHTGFQPAGNYATVGYVSANYSTVGHVHDEYQVAGSYAPIGNYATVGQLSIYATNGYVDETFATVGHTVHNIGTTGSIIVGGTTYNFVNGLYTGI